MKTSAVIHFKDSPHPLTAPKLAQLQSSQALVTLYQVQEFKFLLLTSPDMISNHLRLEKRWEPVVIETIQQFLKPVVKSVVLGIGANLGAISMPMGNGYKAVLEKALSLDANIRKAQNLIDSNY